MRTEAPLDLVVCNLLHLRTPLGVARLGDGKPFLQEVLPFLLALLCQLHSCLEVAGAVNVVITHVLLWSRPSVFVEGNFLVVNQAGNVVPILSSSNHQTWRGAPHEAVILIVRIQGPHPPHRSLTHFSLGPRLLLILDLHGRFPWPLPGLFCHNFLWRLTTPIPRRFLLLLLSNSSSFKWK